VAAGPLPRSRGSLRERREDGTGTSTCPPPPRRTLHVPSAAPLTWIKQPERRLRCLSSGRGNPADQSVVAVVDRADPHTVVRTATLAAPFPTGTTFAVPIVTMPATWTTLARAVVAMNPNNVATHSVRRLSNVRRDSAGHRGGRRQENHCSQGFDHSNHLFLPRAIPTPLPLTLCYGGGSRGAGAPHVRTMREG
jgi:hypothetical protein